MSSSAIENYYEEFSGQVKVRRGPRDEVFPIVGKEILSMYKKKFEDQLNFLQRYPHLSDHLLQHFTWNFGKHPPSKAGNPGWIPPELVLKEGEVDGEKVWEMDLLWIKRREDQELIKKWNIFKELNLLNVIYPLRIKIFYEISKLFKIELWNQPEQFKAIQGDYEQLLFVHIGPLRQLQHVPLLQKKMKELKRSTSPYVYYIIRPSAFFGARAEEVTEEEYALMLEQQSATIERIQQIFSENVDYSNKRLEEFKERIKKAQQLSDEFGYQIKMDEAETDEMAYILLLEEIIRGLAKKSNPNLMDLSSHQKQAAALYIAYSEMRGYGQAESIMVDPLLEDVSCNGAIVPMFVIHSNFGTLETTVQFGSHDELDKFVRRLADKVGRPVTAAQPIVDGTMPNGERINIVFGSDISKKGSNFTIRKNPRPLSITELIQYKTINPEIAGYLWLTLENDENLFFIGETASGKTTSLNAMMNFIPPDYKILSIEETSEVLAMHDNWVQELTRQSVFEAQEVSMEDLLKAGLRQRPNYIIIGEIRGAEGSVAFAAMQTGHPVISTFHADSVRRLTQRLSGRPINVPKPFITNLRLVFIQQALYLPIQAERVRRCSAVHEIADYDDKEDRFIYVPIFSYDPITDRHSFDGKGNSYVLEERIALALGIPANEKFRVYEELDRRARFMKRLTDEKLLEHEVVWLAVTEYQRNWRNPNVELIIEEAKEYQEEFRRRTGSLTTEYLRD